MDLYKYRAEYIDNYDGDTIKFKIDLGFNIYTIIKVRLARIDTPELRDDAQHEQAIVARDFVRRELENASSIIIETFKDRKGKYGRYIAEVYYNGVNLSDKLLQNNLAKVYGEK